MLTVATPSTSLIKRVDSLDWTAIERDLSGYGCAAVAGLLGKEECDALLALYPHEELYRSRVVMSQHGFGRGEYKYFKYPLPEWIAQLRTSAYTHLVPIANRWNESLRIKARYPPQHADFVRRCWEAGQRRPTPLLLRYGPGDYNCLHQDLYGEHAFPIQLTILLSAPELDFSGGEFVITEQRPRMQSRAEVVPLQKGDTVFFAVNERPEPGRRGVHRVRLRHGVSRLRSGCRHSLGIIFHDAT